MGDFDSQEAKDFLLKREQKEREEKEEIRKALLAKVIAVLTDEFKNSSVQIYLVGSIIRPFSFSTQSDVDIVLKNYKGDRFDLWPILERKIGRSIEIIPFETCHFQEFILKDGLKVL